MAVGIGLKSFFGFLLLVKIDKKCRRISVNSYEDLEMTFVDNHLD